MKVINLGQTNSIINPIVREIRDQDIQQDSFRFRHNLERLGELFAYEISKTMEYHPVHVSTSLGNLDVAELKQQPVLATILRAGLPLYQGMLHLFDKANNAFISAYRSYQKNGEFDIQVEYVSSPPLSGRCFIIADPMLATGASMALTCRELFHSHGEPDSIHLVCVIASTEGIEYLKKKMPGKNITLWTAAIDEDLTAKAYIVPGLGDAGDLAYGPKEDVQNDQVY